jgi:shikimate kinase
LNIALFGFMGVGKTVVGKILAEQTGMKYVDLDEIIIQRTGKSVAEIIENDGERVFREIEKKITYEISGLNGQVIACGGGTVLDDENLTNLRRTAKMVLLDAEPEVILGRVEQEEGKRPLLKVNNKLEKINALLKIRKPGYMRAADIVVNTSRKTPKQVASEVLEKLGGTFEYNSKDKEK